MKALVSSGGPFQAEAAAAERFELGNLPPDSLTDPAVRAAISARHDSTPA